jgi:guanylate kinase
MKPIIITITGASGAGKTFASGFLEKERGIKAIVSFTTRPMRETETDGVEHFFVDESQMPPFSRMLAYVKFGGYHYWASLDQVPAGGKCTYVIDEEGLEGLLDKYGRDYEIIPVSIGRDVEKTLKSVSAERVERDRTRKKFPDSFYKYIIENNGTIEEFKEKLLLMYKTVLK